MSEFIDYMSQNQEKIITLLLVNMFIFWLLTISTTHIINFPPDPFYYTKQLPVYYWVGMILACMALILLLHNPQLKSKKYELIQSIGFITILILYLFGTPSFVYTAPRYIDTYVVSNGIIAPVIEVGSARVAYRGFMYQTEFQGSTILFAILIQVIGVSTSLFSKYYIICSMFIISLFVYLIARKVSEKYCLFAPVAYLSLAWTSGYHFCPQSHALMLSIVLLFLLISILIHENISDDTDKKILIIIVWVAICTSHAVTPILNLISLFFLLFLFYISVFYSSLVTGKNMLEGISTKIKLLQVFFILFVTVYSAYILYVSKFIFGRVISTMKTTINNMVYGETFVFVERGTAAIPAQSYIFCYNIRMCVLIGTMIFGLLSILYLFLNSRDRTSSFVISSLFIGYSFLGVFLVISGYNIYGADRSYIFLLVPFSILCSMVLHTGLKIKVPTHNIIASIAPKLFRFFKIGLIVFVIGAMFLIPITRYASEPYEFISESEYAGSEFILQHPSLLPYSRFYTSPTCTNFCYNRAVLKRQAGEEYINNFNRTTRNRIYNSGQCKVHQ